MRIKGQANPSITEESLQKEIASREERARTEVLINQQKELIHQLEKKLSAVSEENQKKEEECILLRSTVEAMNINDRKRMVEFDKLNLQMEKFLYSTSHDLRSPITSILGLVNLLRLESKEIGIIEYSNKIETSAKKLDKTIKDIMAFSRTSYQRLRSDRISFEVLISEVLDELHPEYASRKVQINSEINNEIAFYSDRQRLEMIVSKVVSNAINFYDSRKASPFIKISVLVDLDAATIEIVDNGIGIGRPYLDHIFTMFYKASEISRGAGLGLFIVSEAITQLKGTIKVESEVGFGTCFRINIPNDPKGRLINRKLNLVSKDTDTGK